MSELRNIVNDAMNGLHGWIEAGARQRNKNATGQTMRSLRISTSEGENFAEAALSGEEQWKYWGNGRGPGGMPPVQNLARWAEAKGENASPWALAVNIAKHGTRDYRQKNSNIILDAEQAWQKHDLPKIDERAADIMQDRVIEVAVNSFRHG